MRNFINGLGSGLLYGNNGIKFHNFYLGGGYRIGDTDEEVMGNGHFESYNSNFGNGFGDGQYFGNGSGCAYENKKNYPTSLIQYWE